VRLSELAQQVLLSRSNLTHLLDRLEKAGLLRRERCPSDRRGAYAVLKAQGLALQQKMWIVYADAIGDYFGAHLEDEELKVVERVLQRMIDAVSD
jgi:DNA-binding MarR family transcriptional regulator